MLRILLMFGYFATLQVLTLFLVTDQHLSESASGWLYGTSGAAMSVASIALGSLVDRLGVKRSLIVGSLFAGIGMMMLALAGDMTTIYIALYIVLPLGGGFSMSVFDIATKRYAAPGTQNAAFGLSYMGMNVGAAVAFVTFQVFRWRWPGGSSTRFGYETTNERLLFAISSAVTFVVGSLTAIFAREVSVSVDGSFVVGTQAENRNIARMPAVLKPTAKDENGMSLPPPASMSRFEFYVTRPYCWYRDNVFKRREFYQMMALAISHLFVKQVYRQFDVVMPIWLVRVLGEDAPIGALNTINPVIIIVLFPLSSWLAKCIDIYTLQILGTFVSAASLFILVAPPSIGSISAALVLFSLAEVCYSPLVSAYAMMLAPEGLEGTYSAIAILPTLLSSIFVGPIGGHLLEDMCPKIVDRSQLPELVDYELRQCNLIWAYIGAPAFATSTLLVLFYAFINTEANREKARVRQKELQHNPDDTDLEGIET